MSRLCVPLAAALCAASLPHAWCSPSADADATAPLPVYGYLPEWRYLRWTEEEQSYRWRALGDHVTHLILFSLEVGADGELAATDRFPGESVMRHARAARSATSMRLIISFGGNSRTNGFPEMVTQPELRKKFIASLSAFLEKHALDGVDYNWEYPTSSEEWEGLSQLVKETRESLGSSKVITVAYYPDGHQERLIVYMKDDVDSFLAMSYDQHKEHSTYEFAVKTVFNAEAAGIPFEKISMGLPFYGRDVNTGDWKTYEDIYRDHQPEPSVDLIGNDYFNGRDTIQKKVQFALEKGVGGLMVWEVGQDAFDNEHHSLLEGASLLQAISGAVGRSPAAEGQCEAEGKEC